MAMKINELMIGDWVYNKHHKKNIQIQPYDFFVHGHGNNGTFAVSSTIVSGRDLVPIPLTEEILVKNGFERCDYNNKYFIIDDVIDLITPKWRGGTEYYACAWYQDEFDDLVQHIEICKCAYVHTLQHLLRLCGIEKELVID